jgi:hypothetical protein
MKIMFARYNTPYIYVAEMNISGSTNKTIQDRLYQQLHQFESGLSVMYPAALTAGQEPISAAEEFLHVF